MPSDTPLRDLGTRALIEACVASNLSAVWQELVRRLQPLICAVVANTARRWGSVPNQLIDDLSQETYLKLCANNCRLLRQFSAQSEGALYAYVKTVAASVTHDYLKAEHASKRGGGLQTCNVEDVLASSEGHRLIEGTVLLSQIERALNRVLTGPSADRDRAIFWLYYRQGMTANSIAGIAALNLTVKGVESLLHRITSLVRQELVEQKMGDPISVKG